LLFDDEVAGLKRSLQKIYPITDNELSGLSIVEQVRHFIDGGATLVQIREKKAASHDLFLDVSKAVEIAHEANVSIIVNDRVDIALMTGADGVHLGQGDLPVAAARSVLGKEAIIGISTHSENQVLDALNSGELDYIAFGPIFTTTTKIDHERMVGLDALSRVRELIGDNFPLVAIGGIKVDHLPAVINAGAHSAAMISEFYRAETDISSQFKALLKRAAGNNTVVTT
jgi:thiamine-phosphate pyrophosphorylase